MIFKYHLRDNCGLEILTDQPIERGIRNQGKFFFFLLMMCQTL